MINRVGNEFIVRSPLTQIDWYFRSLVEAQKFMREQNTLYYQRQALEIEQRKLQTQWEASCQ